VEICRFRDRDRPGDGGKKYLLFSAFPKNSTGKGEEMEISGAGRTRRRDAGMGGRSGGEELAEASANANGERKEREGAARDFWGQARGGGRATLDVGPSCQGWKFPEGPGI
jgi:hypothetical protein